MCGTTCPSSRAASGSIVEPLYRSGSTYYGIPFEADTSPLFARLDLLEKATGKREPPKTFDELTEVGKKINSPPNVYALGITLGRVPDAQGDATNIIWNEGGSLVDKDGKVALNSPETVAAMKRVKGWWDDKLIPPDSPTWDDTGNNSAYQKKQAAFVRNPPSIYGWMQTNDTELLENSTMAAFPAGQVWQLQRRRLVVVVDLQQLQERRRRQGPDPLSDGSQAAPGGVLAGRRALVSDLHGRQQGRVLDVQAALQVLSRPAHGRAQRAAGQLSPNPS